jgi:choloylglycine hydrolase
MTRSDVISLTRNPSPLNLLLAAVVFLLLLTGPLTGRARACTSFVQDTPDGPVFGTNLDLLVPADGLIVVNRRGIAKEYFRKGIDGKTKKWVSKYGSVSFDTAGRGFAWSGMNGAGLVISGMEDMASEYPEPDARAPFDIGSWTQYVLDTCATVDDVISVDRVIRPESDNGRPSHFLVADETGKTAALEYIDGKLVVYKGKDLPIRVMSNMPYGRALEAFNRGGARWWWSNPGRSAERFATAGARNAAYDAKANPNEVDYAFHTLSLVSDQYTKWSVGYHIGKRKIWFRTTRDRRARWISLGDLDFSCGAPSLILDVHTGNTGDVTRAFIPYNRETNLKVFETMCARLGIHVPHADAVNLMKAQEEFSCAR